MKDKLLYIVIAILIITQTFSVFQISQLKTKLQQTENKIIYAEERLQGNIGEIYSNVDMKLEEYTSIVSSCSYKIGELNLQTFKVPITFKIQPKILTETTGVFLKFGEEKLPMTRQNSEFVLVKDFSISDEVFPTIIIEDKKVQQFEEHEYLRVYNIKNTVFPSIEPSFEGQSGYSAQAPYEYNMKGDLIIDSLFVNGDNRFKELKYIITLDNKIIKTYEADFVGTGYLNINDNFDMKKGQTLIGKVIAVDKLNFTHEYLIMEYIAGNHEQIEYHYEKEKITAPDGTVIYDFDERKL